MIKIDKPSLINYDDNGAVVIEWIKKNKRFGISIEPIIEHSCWWYSDEDSKYDNCDYLPEYVVSSLKRYFEEK